LRSIPVPSPGEYERFNRLIARWGNTAFTAIASANPVRMSSKCAVPAETQTPTTGTQIATLTNEVMTR
jgi:hypothetical protein